MTTTNSVAIRLATERDLDDIRAIYDHYVATSTCTYQLSAETPHARATWFASHGPRHPVIVAEIDGAIVGWGSLSVHNPREGYARTVDDSLYVRHDFHRRGVGRAILADLIERARSLDHHVVVAGVDAEQTPSLALHASFGFREVGRFREVGFKFGRALDVVYLQKVLET
jgi:phosphinothricin acetyltransferase